MEPTNQPIANITPPPRLRGEQVLAAIMFTDVESFTTVMAADEKRALMLLDRDYRVMERCCQEFSGLILKSLGDGLLIYFSNAENAVSCAIAIQHDLEKAAMELVPQDVLKHRIGIHFGDVIFSGTDVMGNAVNMAARLQKESPAGGVGISQTVYDAIRGRLDIPFLYAGRRRLRGIQEPVPIYHFPVMPPLAIAPTQRIFIAYRAQPPDAELAQQFHQALIKAGHSAFMAGESIRIGANWPQRIESELCQCDYLLLLLSQQSATSEMVIEELRRARELQGSNPDGRPQILPIRLNFPVDSPLNYNLQGYIDLIQYREWHSEADTQPLIEEILYLVSEGRSLAAIEEEPSSPPVSSWESKNTAPLPVAILEMPDGQVDLNSAFYIERPPIEERCRETIVQPGALIRIKAPRQMGKTSLMARVLHYAAQQGHCTVPLSLQLADAKVFQELDQFLRWFCASVSRRLKVPNRLNDYWDEIFGSKDNCTAYFEEYLLENIQSPLVLGLDEVDCVFEHPEIAANFFGLLRAWHEEAKNRDVWKRLRLVVVHATEVYVPMDINQSPFNVGMPIELPEFNGNQVYDLVQLHGLDWSFEQVDRLMDLVGGHPYLVRLALYHLAKGDVTLSQLMDLATTESGLYSDHLRRHLWNLQQNPDLLGAMKQVVSSAAPVRLDSSKAFKLHSMGLVHLQGNEVVPWCNLYRYYLRDRLQP
jgi:class 3 adenylate cyclase